MSLIIKLTHATDGRHVHVNFDHVKYFRAERSGDTFVHFSDDSFIVVTEPVEIVLTALSIATDLAD